MTKVCSGPGQPTLGLGQPGIVTVWVQASSSAAASERAEAILDGREYSSREELSVYLEDPAATSTGAAEAGLHDDVCQSTKAPAGYTAIKKAALENGDGLFEAWL